MSVNLGSIIALLLGPVVAADYGYFYAYMLSAVGLLLGLGNFFLQRKYIEQINTPADKHKIYLKHWVLIILSIAGLTLFSGLFN